MDNHTLYQLIATLSKASEIRDYYTSTHQKNTSNIARLIAQEMHLPKVQIENIRLAALLHDIGKLGVPSAILSKAGKLREEEYDLIKLHSVIGEEILENIDVTFPLAKIVRQHHERLNGSGYPDGLIGNEILMEARVIAVADVVESMSASRAYRKAVGLPVAIDELTLNRGTLYDPAVVDACCTLYEKGVLNNIHSEKIWGKNREKS